MTARYGHTIITKRDARNSAASFLVEKGTRHGRTARYTRTCRRQLSFARCTGCDATRDATRHADPRRFLPAFFAFFRQPPKLRSRLVPCGYSGKTSVSWTVILFWRILCDCTECFKGGPSFWQEESRSGSSGSYSRNLKCDFYLFCAVFLWILCDFN